MELAILLLLILNFIGVIYVCYMQSKKPVNNQSNIELQNQLKLMQNEVKISIENLEKNIGNQTGSLSDSIFKQLSHLSDSLTRSLEQFEKSTSKQQESLTSEIRHLSDANTRNNQNLNETVNNNIKDLNKTVSDNISALQKENTKQLQEIKNTVDEQLQTNLDRKLKESFDSVVKQLSSVERGLGEVRGLANSVGDLKKTLSNVKTRGILGELQLGSILEQILSPGQYETNVATVKGSKNRVEFAIKLPGKEDNECVYLPIDSKFPGDTYNALLDAYDNGDRTEIEVQKKNLEKRILEEAKDISSKYIHVPETTEFAILFVPVDGLYAEIVSNVGLIEKLQNQYKINVAGPTTMAALLNSFQMGFRTLAIQKRSSEVWEILGKVKTEFEKYNRTLESVQKRIKSVDDELENLIGVRTRQMNRQLSHISDYQEKLENGSE